MTAAEELREAARLMRERAQAATAGPWWLHPAGEFESVWHGDRQHLIAYDADPDKHDVDPLPWGTVATLDAPYRSAREQADATYIASWHPDVAVAVADWLDDEAHRFDVEQQMRGRPTDYTAATPALAVARAYLGTTT